MPILCYGLNHEAASVEIREKVSLSEKEVPFALETLQQERGIEESVILSTCNRMEIYVSTHDAVHESSVFDRLDSWVAARFDLTTEELSNFYRHRHREAVNHLFAVASGLNSMVLGETEIFGQVKKAYAIAHTARTTSKVLNKLFQRTFQVGKQVRTQTHITRGATSVGSVGVDLAEKIFGDLRRCKILIIGAGEMSQRTAQSLQSRGVKTVFVSNRSYDKAVELAARMDGKAVRFDQWDEEFRTVDIIISSTAAPHHVITLDRIQPHLRSRRGRPLFMIDLSVPRDIAPEVSRLEDVYVYDIDTLQGLAENAKCRRKEQIQLCEQLIESHVRELFSQTYDPPIQGTPKPNADPLTTS